MIKAANNFWATLAWVRTRTRATFTGVLQLEANVIDVKNMNLHRDSNPGLWNTFPVL